MGVCQTNGAYEYTLGDLRITYRDSFAIVAINRTDKLNALRQQFWGDLRTTLRCLENEEKVRAIILTGSGDRAFSVGGDIGSFACLKTQSEKRAYQQDVMQAFLALETSPLPVIAAVNGYALGGGCELTLACDMVIASDRASFALPESGLGLVPGYGVLRAPSMIGRQMTKLLVMAGERINAHQALQCGLVQRVVVHDHLMSEAETLAGKIAANSRLAHDVGKRIINRGIDRAEFDYSVEALTLLHSSSDAVEGIRAFVERRKPKFT